MGPCLCVKAVPHPWRLLPWPSGLSLFIATNVVLGQVCARQIVSTDWDPFGVFTTTENQAPWSHCYKSYMDILYQWVGLLRCIQSWMLNARTQILIYFNIANVHGRCAHFALVLTFIRLLYITCLTVFICSGHRRLVHQCKALIPPNSMFLAVSLRARAHGLRNNGKHLNYS